MDDLKTMNDIVDNLISKAMQSLKRLEELDIADEEYGTILQNCSTTLEMAGAVKASIATYIKLAEESEEKNKKEVN